MKSRDYKDATDLIAHTLRAEGHDATEDGTGRGTPLVPVEVPERVNTLTAKMQGQPGWAPYNETEHLIAFDSTQISNPDNGSNPLAAKAHPPAIAFTSKDYGADAGEVSPTLRAMNGREMNGGGQVAIAFQSKQSAAAKYPSFDDVTPTLDVAKAGGMAVAGTTAGGEPMTTKMRVRRLTPRECERLQGFQWRCAPDEPGAWEDELGRWWSPDYTAGFSDSTRYKMLGNAVAVPCVRWIAKRIARQLHK